jgi:ferredoxin-type protein NapH
MSEASMTAGRIDTRAPRSVLASRRWLIARRVSQLGILALFLLGPLAGIWIVKGNLSSSLTLGVLPLTDPYVLLQSLAAGHALAGSALAGAAIVAGFYLLVGGRAYCSWVCPVNMVTDAAAWLRRRIGLAGGRTPSKQFRYWLLAATLAASAATGSIVWEFVNPVSMFHRGLLFGMGLAWLVVAGVFLYDLAVSPRGWCGHVCPVGAAYSVIGKVALVRVAAPRRAACDDCGDCFKVCPEVQVIRPALKGTGSPVITAANCTNCGRCVDVCHAAVFRYTHRFDRRTSGEDS